jgi:hypothetical protein
VFTDDPTVADLAALVQGRIDAEGGADPLPPLRRVSRPGPVSYAQARYLGWEQWANDTPRWAAPFRVSGALDHRALRVAVDAVVCRHEILHTSYTFDGRRWVAVVRPPAPCELPVHDLRAEPDPDMRTRQIVAAELAQPFDLERGPLLKFVLLRLADEEHQLLRFTHHVIHDVDSWPIFFRDLAVAYEAVCDGRPPPRAAAPLQYIDFAAWERAWVNAGGARRDSEIMWWQNTLASPPAPLTLPFVRPEPALEPDELQGNVLRWGLPPRASPALDRVARDAGATYFMSRLATFVALLAADTGAEDLMIAMMLRLALRTELSFRATLAEVRRAVLESSRRVSLPFEVLARELYAPGAELPLPSARCVISSPRPPTRFGGIEIEALPRQCAEMVGFRLGFNRRYEADRCWAEFDRHRYDPIEVSVFLERLASFAALAGTHPDRPVAQLQREIGQF